MILLVSLAEAGAHPNLQDAMWVQFEPLRVRVAVTVTLREIAVAQGLEARAAGTTDWTAAAEHHGDYVRNHLRLLVGNAALAGRVVRVTAPAAPGEPEATFYQYELVYPLEGPPPSTITFYQNMLQEWPYALGIAWEVSYVVRTKRPEETLARTWLLRRDQTESLPTGWTGPAASPAPPPPPQNWHTFRDYFWQGMLHILTGYDHLLFVSALVVAALNVWEMFKVIAAFTLAHSLTLTLCVFNIVRLPAFVVEPVIALSIIFVALENVFWPHRAHSRFRLAVAFGFGLVHGLGFAGGLLDAMTGLPATSVWIALGAFSLGVETGHQLVVLPLFGLLALSRRELKTGWQNNLRRYGSGIICAGGACYFLAAVHEQFFNRWQ